MWIGSLCDRRFHHDFGGGRKGFWNSARQCDGDDGQVWLEGLFAADWLGGYRFGPLVLASVDIGARYIAGFFVLGWCHLHPHAHARSSICKLSFS